MALYGLHNLIKMFLYLEGPKELEIRNKTLGTIRFSVNTLRIFQNVTMAKTQKFIN